MREFLGHLLLKLAMWMLEPYWVPYEGVEDVACAECGELIDSCECEDGFFAEEIEDE